MRERCVNILFLEHDFRSPPDLRSLCCHEKHGECETRENRKVKNYGKGKTDEILIVLCSLLFFTVNMGYDLEDLKTLAMHWDDDQDVEDLLLLKYLEREEDLARAALRHRMHVFDFESLECKDFKNKFRFKKRKKVKSMSLLCADYSKFLTRWLEITELP